MTLGGSNEMTSKLLMTLGGSNQMTSKISMTLGGSTWRPYLFFDPHDNTVLA